jgi:hypothetical protein
MLAAELSAIPPEYRLHVISKPQSGNTLLHGLFRMQRSGLQITHLAGDVVNSK